MHGSLRHIKQFIHVRSKSIEHHKSVCGMTYNVIWTTQKTKTKDNNAVKSEDSIRFVPITNSNVILRVKFESIFGPVKLQTNIRIDYIRIINISSNCQRSPL
jgi:hypothetical protein